MTDNAELASPPTTGLDSGRLQSLDVFRGLTIAAMILVNNGGGPGTYPPLRHAPWDGWTPTDLVFPFFLLIVGIAIPFSLGKRKSDGSSRIGLLFRIVRRAVVIFAIGLALNGFPEYHLATLRIPGVLQRIAVCYLLASLVELTGGVRFKMATVVVLLVGYWGVMTFVAVPGYHAGDLSRAGNLAAWVDRLVLPGHLYKADYDPEGLLSTLPALATTLIGALAGHWLRSKRDGYEKDAGLFFAGSVGVALGWAWSATFPINKALWTGSFVLLTAGLGLQLFAACYWLVDLRLIRRWAAPFVIFGRNAIAAYVFAAFLARLASWPWGPELRVTTRDWLYGRVFAPVMSQGNASLAYALLFVAICFGFATLLHRRGIYIKA